MIPFTLWLLDGSVAPASNNWIAYKDGRGRVHLRVLQPWEGRTS